MSKKAGFRGDQVVYACVFLSGFAGLAYEVLWIRVLSLALGSTAAAMAVVLSVFFLGLSLGSYIGGRIADRARLPLALYGKLEIFLGLFSAALIFVLYALPDWIALLPLAKLSPTLVVSLQIFVAALLILPPTACMGATIPVVTADLVRRDGRVGRHISLLYALNTFGAVAGATLTGFFLIPSIGVTWANAAAASVNLLVGGVAWVMARRVLAGVPAVFPAPEIAFSRGEFTPRKLLAATALCGFSSIAAEVVWSKYLSIYFGTNIFGLGLVLGVFLFGVALGSAIDARLQKNGRDPKPLLRALLTATPLLILASTYLLNQAPVLAAVVQNLTAGKIPFLVIKSLVAGIFLLPSTMAFGILFPLILRLMASANETAARECGRAYAINTLGSILGSLVSGLVLVPLLGSSAAILVACLALAVGAFFISARTTVARTAVALAACAASVAVPLWVGVDFRNILKSAYHQSIVGPEASLKEVVAPFRESYEEFKMVKEGKSGIISLSQDPRDGENYKEYLRLKTNGLNESIYALSQLDVLPRYEALLGLLPYLASRNPKKAFVVGYGGGFTVDLLSTLDLHEVRVVELERGILDAAQYVYKGDNPILKRKSVRLEIDDARYALTLSRGAQYDIIVSQPSHSWLSGAANLFTKEFFEIVQRNLAPTGVYAQWLNLYNMDSVALKSLLGTFYSVFPEGAVFTRAGDQEMILLGSRHPIRLTLGKLDAMFANVILRSKLSNLVVESPRELLASYQFSAKAIQSAREPFVVNTDRNAYAEARQSRLFYRSQSGDAGVTPYLTSLFTGDYEALVGNLTAENPQFWRALLTGIQQHPESRKFDVALTRYETLVSADRSEWGALGFFLVHDERLRSAYRFLFSDFTAKRQVPELERLLSSLTSLEKYAEVLKVLKENPRLHSPLAQCYEGLALVKLKETVRARRLFAKLGADVPGYTEACGDFYNKVMGHYYHLIQDYPTAIPFLEAHYKASPRDLSTLQVLTSAYHGRQDYENRDAFEAYYRSVVTSEVARLEKRALELQEAHHDDDSEVLRSRAAALSSAFL